MKNGTPTVFVIDDDDAVRSSLRLLFKSYGLDAVMHASADEFLAGYDISRPGCLVLDVRMPGMSGPELQQRLNALELEPGSGTVAEMKAQLEGDYARWQKLAQELNIKPLN